MRADVTDHSTAGEVPWSFPRGRLDVRKEIRVFGMRRSGNHAIINWIIKQVTGPVFFLNNTHLLRPLWLDRDFVEKRRAVFFRNDGESLTPIWQDNGRFPDNLENPLELFVHSYENQRFAAPFLRVSDYNKARIINPPKERYDVLILRDPFNLFASQLQSGMVFSGHRRYTRADLWLYYAEEYLSETGQLGPDKVCVNYNRWCVDQGYRRAVAVRLGIPFTDKGFDEVSSAGRGSSFDGRRFDGNASKMKTGARWREYAGDPRFIDQFRDPRLMALSEAIFGQIDGTRELLGQKIARPQRWLASLRRLWVRHGVMRLMDWRMGRQQGQYMVSPDER